MLKLIQPILDCAFYMTFGIYFSGQTNYEQCYRIFALVASLYYILFFLPYKFNKINLSSRLVSICTGGIGIISFILSVFLSYEDVFFARCYWTTLAISTVIGTYLVKTKMKSE
ncbi:unnamed protein product [Paramecium octaurelia]|uniref:Uncharacterized protein n=1 Tax=Paramecium octaurelia TaxID=43137 RepID=A0A8S1Y6N4_PAROT|nr:unnamed protein product [Paramecium octaurelia]